METFANGIMTLKCNIEDGRLVCLGEEIDGTEHRFVDVKRMWSSMPLKLSAFEITQTSPRKKSLSDGKPDIWLGFSKAVKIRTGIAEDLEGRPTEMSIR